MLTPESAEKSQLEKKNDELDTKLKDINNFKTENHDLKGENNRLKNKNEELNIELKDKNYFKNENTGLKAENNRLKEELNRSRELEHTSYTVKI